MSLPARMSTIALLVAAATCTLLWRQWSAAWVLAPSAIVVATAIAMRLRWGTMPRVTAALLAMATITAPLISQDWLWPCGLACQGSTYYASLWGTPVWAWGMAAYGLSLAAVLTQYLRPHPLAAAAAQIGLAACLGASLWFLWLSWSLTIVCGHCLALHTLVTAAAVLGLGRATPRAWPAFAQPLAIVLLAGLGLHAIFHPQPVQELLSGDHPSSDPDQRLAQQIAVLEEGLYLGSATAPWQADLVLDPLCPHCGEAWRTIAQELGPLVGDGSLRLRLRLRHNPRLPLSRFLAESTVASAADQQLATALPHLIGYSQRDSEELLRRRWQQGGRFSPARSDTIRALIPDAIALLLANDTAWLQQQRLLNESTPVLVVRQSGVEFRQVFAGHLNMPEILRLLSGDKE